MKRPLLSAALLVLFSSEGGAAPEFAPPIPLEAAQAAITVDKPGYACPTWGDWDGDGVADLLVGQMSGGHMSGHIHFFKNLGKGADGLPKLDRGEKIQTSGRPTEVPGVW